MQDNISLSLKPQGVWPAEATVKAEAMDHVKHFGIAAEERKGMKG